MQIGANTGANTANTGTHHLFNSCHRENYSGEEWLCQWIKLCVPWLPRAATSMIFWKRKLFLSSINAEPTI